MSEENTSKKCVIDGSGPIKGPDVSSSSFSGGLADKRLYKVKGVYGSFQSGELLVLANDAGMAEWVAAETWRKWKYGLTPVSVELIAVASQYGKPKEILSLVC